MEEAYLSTDPRILSLLLVLGFAFALAWIIAGIAKTRGAGDAEASDLPRVRVARERPTPPRFDTPDRRDAPIGRYMDCTIFETVSIAGVEYRFDHVLAPGARWHSELGERCVSPGLVYVTR